MMDSLAFIDMTFSVNEDNRPDLVWRNDEVMALLSAVRDLIVSDIEPTLHGLGVVPVSEGTD